MFLLPSGDYVNTKEYRVPEWVTRMEEIQKRLSGKCFSACGALGVTAYRLSRQDYT